MHEYPQARMFKIWTCLAISMTGGSLLLAWMEPNPANPPSATSSGQSVELARLAVGTCLTPRPSWESIEILPLDRLPDADRLTLTSVGPAPEVHFVVTRRGAVLARPSWREQSLLDGGPHIRVGIECQHRDDQPERSQLLSLTALLEELNTTLVTTSAQHPLPVRVDAGVRDGSVGQSLRDILAAFGSISHAG